MRNKHHLARPVLTGALLFMILTGIAYPLVTTLAAQALFPDQANGSLVRRDGAVVGSAVIGQNFASPAYFHGRPSATQAPSPDDPSQSVDQPYNAGLSNATNQGVLSKKLNSQVAAAIAAYRQENGMAAEVPVPVDAVTSSASGLDPDISLANARLQAARVAATRGLPAAEISALVEHEITPRQFGLLGDPRLNVLSLNSALDRLAQSRSTAH